MYGLWNPRIRKLLKRRKGNNGYIIDIYHTNKFLNKHEYEMKLYDVSYHEVAANQIVETMVS